MNTTPHWEHFEHEADIGIRGYGHTLSEAFEQSALALCALITELTLIKPENPVQVFRRETNRELLLADWLNAIIFEIATRKMLFSRFDVDINDGQLEATAWGEAINVDRHHPAVEIKGATYTLLAVVENRGEWIAQCVVDV